MRSPKFFGAFIIVATLLLLWFFKFPSNDNESFVTHKDCRKLPENGLHLSSQSAHTMAIALGQINADGVAQCRAMNEAVQKKQCLQILDMARAMVGAAHELRVAKLNGSVLPCPDSLYFEKFR